MICPYCQQQGEASRVSQGASVRTLMGWTPVYDEQGRAVSSDPNKTTTSYSCSRGHSWGETTGARGFVSRVPATDLP